MDLGIFAYMEDTVLHLPVLSHLAAIYEQWIKDGDCLNKLELLGRHSHLFFDCMATSWPCDGWNKYHKSIKCCQKMNRLVVSHNSHSIGLKVENIN